MKTYNVKIVSQENSILFILLALIIFLSMAFLFFPLPLSTFLIYVLMGGVFVITYFLWQKFVTGRVEWRIDEEGIYMRWIKHFAYNKKDDISLKWSEIKKIYQGLDPQYDTFKIELLSGTKFKFYHDNLTTRDDYAEFKKELYQIFNEKKIINSNISQQ